MNTPIISKALEHAFDACTPFLTTIDRAIDEAEENLRKLRLVRSVIKTDMIGINKTGLQKAMSETGTSLTPSQHEDVVSQVKKSLEVGG